MPIAKGLGLTPLLGDRRGFMPPQLKTNKTFEYTKIILSNYKKLILLKKLRYAQHNLFSYSAVFFCNQKPRISRPCCTLHGLTLRFFIKFVSWADSSNTYRPTK